MRWNPIHSLLIAALASAGAYYGYQRFKPDAPAEPVTTRNLDGDMRDARISQAMALLRQPVIIESPAAPSIEADLDLPVALNSDRTTVRTAMGEPLVELDGGRSWTYPDHVVLFRDDKVSGVVERSAAAPAANATLSPSPNEIARFTGVVRSGRTSSAPRPSRTSPPRGARSKGTPEGYTLLSPSARYGLTTENRTRLHHSAARSNRARQRSRSMYGVWSPGDYGQMRRSTLNRLDATSNKNGYQYTRYGIGNKRVARAKSDYQRYQSRLGYSLRYHFTSPDRRTKLHGSPASSVNRRIR